MKSHELAKLLLDNPDVELIMQKDGEGNGYSPLEGVDFDTIYIPDSTYSGDVYSTGDTAEDCGLEDEEWVAMKGNSIRCAVLFPVN